MFWVPHPLLCVCKWWLISSADGNLHMTIQQPNMPYMAWSGPNNSRRCAPSQLTHWGRVTHIFVSNLTIIGSDNGLLPCRHPSHYLNQSWNIIDWSLRNILQWNLNQNSYIFIQENAFENVVCKMASILSRPQWVKMSYHNSPIDKHVC